jgi:hypothetical protein
MNDSPDCRDSLDIGCSPRVFAHPADAERSSCSRILGRHFENGFEVVDYC